MPNPDLNSIRPARFSANVLLGIILLAPLQLLGAESAASQVVSDITAATSTTTETPAAIPLDMLDTPRNFLSDKLVGYAANIDRFFGGDSHYEESNKSVFQLGLSKVSGYGGDPKLKLSGRVNLRLPSTEGRLHLLLETDPEQYMTSEPAKSQTVLRNQVAAPTNYALAARYAKELQDIWHFNMDWGVKFRGITTDPNPFVRTRGSYSVPLGEWRLKISESVFWFKTIGAGETTRLDLEHFLTEPTLFRASSTATWLHLKQNFDLRQDFSVYQTMNDRNALLYQASVLGVSNPTNHVTEYVLLVNYRYRMHRDWLFFDLSPQLHFPKAENYQRRSSLMLRLEMLFDKSR